MSRYVQALSVGEVAVLDTLRGIQNKHGKSYCYPSQDTILDFLDKFHHIRICKRTLNYWLKKLTLKGLIYRVRRLTRPRFMSTAYYLLDRGGFGVVKAKKLIGMAKRLRSVLPSRAQRFANDRHTAQCQNSGGRLKEQAAPAPEETKRCEASGLEKDLTAPEPGQGPKEGEERPRTMRECLEKVLCLDKARLLRKTGPLLE